MYGKYVQKVNLIEAQEACLSFDACRGSEDSDLKLWLNQALYRVRRGKGRGARKHF
jgi:hypothetical protein